MIAGAVHFIFLLGLSHAYRMLLVYYGDFKLKNMFRVLDTLSRLSAGQTLKFSPCLGLLANWNIDYYSQFISIQAIWN